MTKDDEVKRATPQRQRGENLNRVKHLPINMCSQDKWSCGRCCQNNKEGAGF